jgi:hypothetical protein
MKFRMWLAVVCVAAVASVLMGWQAGRAQAPQSDDLFDANADSWQNSPSRANPFGNKGERVRAERREIQNGPWKQKFEFKTGPDSMNEIQSAAKELHDAKEEEARAKAEKKLSGLLNKYFEEDMKRREEELKKVEARVKNLRALLQKRREKQEEILDLQMKVLLNEADGLGFFNNAMPPGQPGWPLFLDTKVMPRVNSADGAVIYTPSAGGATGLSAYGTSGGTISISTGVPAPPKPPRAAPAAKAKPAPRAPRAARAGAASSSSKSDATWEEDATVDEAAESGATPSAEDAPAVETPAEEVSIEERP